MNLSEKEINNEKEYLNYNLKIIRNKISELGQVLYDREEKVMEFKKFIWDTRHDMDPTEMKTMINASDLEVTLMGYKGDYLQKLYRIQNNPYFGSITFKDSTGENKIYIGITHVEDEENDKYLVHDWRAPICSLFYDYELGKAQYLAPEGIIKGEITNKRQFTIKDGKLIRVFDNDINIDDELLQQVLVEEPSIDDSIGILEGIKKYYEEYHKVKISSDIIRQAVIMSEKYIHDRFLPDKAIDILDEACSRINLENKDLFKLEMLKQELAKVQSEKEEVIAADSTEDYQKAADLKTRECQLIEEIDKLSAKAKPKQLNVQDIANVIESWTKIPVKKITEAETQKLLNLETNLHKRIIGQDEAVSSVARAIRRNRAGLQSTKRPPSFIFVGPTGVGKTELAKSLAYEMFGSEDSIIRIDMSEYMESHSTSKLIGAPPGYVGYDDAGQLTDKVKRKPYSIILLDEIEKAHPDVFNILLQVLDDGKLTDSQGNTVSFSNTIIIMTSNAGSNSNINSIGFGKQSIDKNKIMDSLKELFRPEFLNRVDEIIQFDSLTKEQLLKIVDLMLENTRKALNEKDINMDITKKAKNYLLEKGTDIKFGARPLRRAIQRYIEDELSEMILRSQLLDGQTVKVDFENDKLKFEVK